MKQKNLIIKSVKSEKSEKFLGLYKSTTPFDGISQDVYSIFWCDAVGNILDITSGSVKTYFKFDLAQSYLFAFADGYEKGISDK